MKPSRNIRTLVVIPADIHEVLKVYATRNIQYNGSVSGVIRAAVGEFVRTHNLKATNTQPLTTTKQPTRNAAPPVTDDDEDLGITFDD